MIAVARRCTRQPREYVDFAHVPPSQWAMHDRLENWARWCRGSERQAGDAASPMFALYRSTDAKTKERLAYGAPTEVPIDKMDAQAVQKGINALPDKHRRALHWSYLRPRNPTAQARELGLSLGGLADMVLAARQMLVNRRV